MATKTTLDQHTINKVKAYMVRLNEAGIIIAKAMVFGSRAKGKAKEWSDIDVGIVSENFGNDYHNELVTLLKLRGTEFADIEPHPFSPADINDRYDPLASEVRKYGIRIT
ncbi:nucleotidyltransferase domain-containing protein [Patescibacteria group bacterium]|nr:nucleotidyltransferase domain-containing protein [Patescibacteria group bacterium]